MEDAPQPQMRFKSTPSLAACATQRKKQVLDVTSGARRCSGLVDEQKAAALKK